jgi:hypothetical protein
MDYQGARRTRPPADLRQAPWPQDNDPGPGSAPSPGTGGHRALDPGSGPQRLSGPATAPQQLPLPQPGTGAQRLAGPATGPQRLSGPGTGPQQLPLPQPGTGAQRLAGPATGPQRLSGPRTGPQPAVNRTPVRGFPPMGPGYEQPPTPPDGFDAVPPASIGPGSRRHGGRGGEPTGPRRISSRMAWLAAAAVVILAGGGYAGYKYLYEPRVNAPVPASLRLPTDAPGSPGFNDALGKWQHIVTRAQDPEPLTLDELFPVQFELYGSSYTRTAADVTKNCSLAVFGSNLQAALQSGHCTQVLRASYISGNGTMMGTVGVANLSSSADAQKAGQVTGPQQIIAPLAAQKGPTSKLGNGTGVIQAEIKGHYLILMWAEFTNLKSPSTSAQRQQLEQFATDLVTGSANIDLSTRMLTGKP